MIDDHQRKRSLTARAKDVRCQFSSLIREYSMTEAIAYKVLSADAWRELVFDTFLGAPIDLADGFIHLSTASQLTETVDRHFCGQKALVIAAIDIEALKDSVRWEPSRDGQLFPHLYGRLLAEHVLASGPLERRFDGTVQPPKVR